MDSDSFRKISALACMLFDIMLAYEGERARQGVAFVADLRTVRVGSITGNVYRQEIRKEPDE